MVFKEFYDLSKLTVDLLGILGKQLVSFQLFRYKMIVDSSSRGIDCPYAIGCYRLSYSEIDQLKEVVAALKKHIDLLENRLNEFYGRYDEPTCGD